VFGRLEVFEFEDRRSAELVELLFRVLHVEMQMSASERACAGVAEFGQNRYMPNITW
jgi:hypothetical protein